MSSSVADPLPGGRRTTKLEHISGTSAPSDGTKRIGHRNLRRILLTADSSAAATAWLGAALAPGVVNQWDHLLAAIGITIASATLTVAFMASQQLYRSRACTIRTAESQRLARALMLTALLLLAGAQLSSVPVQYDYVLIGVALAFPLLLATRAGYRSWIRQKRRSGQYSRPVVLVGANQDAAEFLRIVREHPEMGYEVTGVVGSYEESRNLDAPWLGDFEEAVDKVHAVGATGVVMFASAVPAEKLNPMVRQLLEAGLHVHLQNGVWGVASSRLRVTPIAHEPVIYIEQPGLLRWQTAAKRAMDILLAALILAASLPLLAAAAVAIRLEDGGPVLFRQERVGRNGRRFSLYKLRTMVPDAEQRLEQVRHRNQRDGGPLFKLAKDPRVTRTGRLLRATSIDELPQLFNVLGGSMSLVGPRPALPTEMASFDEDLRARTRVMPGITGLWQVEARDNPAFGPYRRLDLYYVENWTVGLDLVILLGTVAVVVGRAWRALFGKRTSLEPALFD